MARMERVKTSYTGVYYRQHPTDKHNGKPVRYFDVVFPCPETRKLIWRCLGKSSDKEIWTPAKAAKRREELIEELRHTQGNPQAATQDVTFDEAWKLYLENYAKKLKKSWGNDDAGYRKYFKEEFGHLRLSQITQEEISDFVAKHSAPADAKLKRELILAHVKAGGKGSPFMSGSTMRSYLYILSKVFEYAIKNPKKSGYTGTNPILLVDKPTKDGNRERALTRDEAQILLAELRTKSEQLFQICALSLDTGMRVGEIFDMCWRDINLEAGYINIPDAKGGKDQKVFLPEQAIIRFSAEWLRPAEDNESDYVFKDRYGKKIKQTSNSFQKIADRLFNENSTSAKDKVVAHTLRHTYCTWLAQSGTVDPYQLMQIMRHKSFSTTQKYLHLMPSHGGRKGADAINRMFSSDCQVAYKHTNGQT